MPKAKKTAPGQFAETYPNIANWVLGGGWIEMGQTCGFGTPSLTRALDEGGMVFEGANSYPSLEAALEALDLGIKAFLDENG